MALLLIIDDEQTICWGLAKLAKRMGHEAQSASSAEEALEILQSTEPAAVMLDVRLPGMDGLEAMQQIRPLHPNVPVVIMTAYGDLGTAVEAVRGGAFEYLVKPFDLTVAERIIERALAKRAEPPASPPRPPSEAAGQLVGKTPAMQEVFKRIALVSGSDACVHLHGESGTGKELVARAIHRYSRRSTGPFVAVNLAALSPSLAESELFGHVRGAFTGAQAGHRGLLEQANKGTIFLDEVADIPLPLQVKLLRALEHAEVTPVGGDGATLTDFRVVSATHQDLSQVVAAGDFRHDLFFRLSTFQIDIPPLRDRREDIADLCEHFLHLLAGKHSGNPPALSTPALEALCERPWYGNVRELRNSIEHAMILARTGTILPEHLPPPAAATGPTAPNEEQALQQLVRRWSDLRLADDAEPGDLYDRLLSVVEPPLLEAALGKHHGQCAAAARSLGLHRMTLRKKLDQFGISPSM